MKINRMTFFEEERFSQFKEMKISDHVHCNDYRSPIMLLCHIYKLSGFLKKILVILLSTFVCGKMVEFLPITIEWLLKLI